MAVALPLALLLGVIGELFATAVLKLGGRRGGGWPRLRRRLRAVASPGEGRPTLVEAGGAVAAMLGAALAAGSALGLGPGSVALVYLGLAVAAIGSHAAAQGSSASQDRAGERLGAAVVEPVFVVALGAMFLRWGTSDLEAVRGTQAVLGPGVVVGPVGAAVGLALAGLLAAVSGALRFASPPTDPPASALLIRLARWSGGGATALVVAILVGGSNVGAANIQELAVFAATAVVAAVVVATSDMLLRGLRGRWRLGLAAVLLLAAVVSVVLVAA